MTMIMVIRISVVFLQYPLVVQLVVVVEAHLQLLLLLLSAHAADDAADAAGDAAVLSMAYVGRHDVSVS
jgi:hypothetical protein